MIAVTGPLATMLSSCTTCRLWDEQDERPGEDGCLAGICLVVPAAEGPS